MDTTVASRIEGALVLRGVLAIVFGIIALRFTGQTLLVLVYVLGAFALLSGLLTSRYPAQPWCMNTPACPRMSNANLDA